MCAHHTYITKAGCKTPSGHNHSRRQQHYKSAASMMVMTSAWSVPAVCRGHCPSCSSGYYMRSPIRSFYWQGFSTYTHPLDFRKPDECPAIARAAIARGERRRDGALDAGECRIRVAVVPSFPFLRAAFPAVGCRVDTHPAGRCVMARVLSSPLPCVCVQKLCRAWQRTWQRTYSTAKRHGPRAVPASLFLFSGLLASAPSACLRRLGRVRL